MDIYNTEKFYQKEFEKIDNWHTSNNNKETFKQFLMKMQSNGIGCVQLTKYLFSMALFVKNYSKTLEKVKKTDIDNFLFGMNDKSVKTRKIRYYCLKKFFEFIDKKELFQNNGTHFQKVNKKLPEILTKDEINKLIEACDNARDRAFISCLYESGCRIGEFLNLKISDIEFDEYGSVLKVNGKTGSRRVRIIKYTSYLQNWLQMHPEKDNKDSWVWFSRNNKRLCYKSIKDIFKKIKAKSSIEKRLYPHIFRHTRATELANKLTEAQMKEFFGWTQASSMASIYVHLCGRDLDEPLLKVYGLTTNGNTTKEEIKKCARCQTINPDNAGFCIKCGFPTDERAMLKSEKIVDLTIKFLNLLAEDNPKIKEKFNDLVKQENAYELFGVNNEAKR